MHFNCRCTIEPIDVPKGTLDNPIDCDFHQRFLEPVFQECLSGHFDPNALPEVETQTIEHKNIYIPSDINALTTLEIYGL